ncbi:MAG: HAD family hydrolase [Phascolarctobacterium sp.]|nr:HAD family hydrolase [Phascolarctobacterium sp.]
MKAVFLDRDGIINVDVAYLYKIEEFQWVEGCPETLAYLTELGYKIFVVTNQSGVARGYFDEAAVHKLHDYIASEASKFGGKIEKFYYCPHLKDGSIPKYAIECNCRKPKPGMLLQAFSEYDLDKEQCFLIGDGKRDVEAAESAGIKGYLYQGGSLLEFTKNILKG